ncbi:Rep [uncultured virus]|uniref:Rep n=1 Tax=uncultured virus TaxID=340016 RepID=A0A2K9LT11_9VIRU|nr:Rep [uncultured virus]
MPSFDLHCRYALLTYAQSGDLSGTLVGERLSSMGYSCVIGRENHQDGGTHLHAFVDFGHKRRFRRPDVFDVAGCHPNISPSKGTPAKGWEYAVKDGDIVWSGLERPGPSGDRDSNTLAKWSKITSASDRQSFWDLVHELDPKSAACSFTQLSKYCDWKFATHTPDYEHPGSISFTTGESDGRDQWLLQSGIGLGGSTIGKLVQWAGRSKILLGL